MLFHLAIPVRDLDEAVGFYESLGAKCGRRYIGHAVMRFYDVQLVCHVSGLWDKEAETYPRHFGVIVTMKSELGILWERWRNHRCVHEEYFVRHEGRPEEHHTFFLVDPSNNVIEFKWYKNRHAVFG